MFSLVRSHHQTVKRCSRCAAQFKMVHQSASLEKSSGGDDYQFLHRSPVHSMHFQKSLFRLPIPELSETCAKYLRSQKAIQSEEDHAKTCKAVQEFNSGIGIELQKGLKAYDKENKHTSYISGPWFDMYLSDRLPIVLNYNPFFCFQPDERPGYGNQLIRATNLLVSSMRFQNTLRRGYLEPEVFHLNPAKSNTPLFRRVTRWTPSPLATMAAYTFKAFPLDMSQFKNLFNSTRIPLQGKDCIREYPEAKHVLIMKNGNFYVFDIFDRDGSILPPSHVHACMSYIHDDDAPPPEFPISVLTSIDRDKWADMRQQLVAAGNGEALDTIDSASFNLVLDDADNKIKEGEPDAAGIGFSPDGIYKTFLFGDAKNRWFDKSFSLIVTADGMTGINFEHAWGDGVAVMRYFNEVADDHIEKSAVHPDSRPANIDPTQYVKRLDFQVPQSVGQVIKDACQEYDRWTGTLKMNYFESDGFNRKICKQHKLSPDAIMQLGFQVAHALQFGYQVPTYESCSTAAFKHGRTETLRPATLETTEFAKTVTQPEYKFFPKEELKKLLFKCSAKHAELTKEAAMGKGFDRHLFGLKMIAEREGVNMPSLFTDPAYARINYNILSTSTLPSTKIVLGGFGPTVKDGFGIGYRIEEERYGLVVSTYDCHANGDDFIRCAEQAYQKIFSVLNS